MAAPTKTEFEAVMNKSQFVHTLAHAGFRERVDRALFQHAGANTAFDIRAAARFDDDGFDAAADYRRGGGYR